MALLSDMSDLSPEERIKEIEDTTRILMGSLLVFWCLVIIGIIIFAISIT